MSNSVKLYSNGTAVIEREYQIEGSELKVTIPVKKTDLDDVVSSISVYGNVNLPVPPSYTPVNAVDTKLQIDPAKAFKDTLVKLAGSRVKVRYSSVVEGKLAGVHSYEETNANGMTSERLKVVVLTNEGIKSIDEKEISSISFLDERDQAEYEKALNKVYQTIKPDASFVDLTIVPVGAERNTLVTYSVPVAAWKSRYHLRINKGKAELVGQAVVDNDTDDDWKDTIISVITGEPINFSTDLAEIRRPVRTKINVVNDKAQSAVGVEDAINRQRFAAPMGMARAAARGGAMPKGYTGDDAYSLQQCASGTASLDVEYCDDVGGGLEAFSVSADGPQAQQQQADVRDSGDFSVFTSPNKMNVGSKKSAIVPMFRAELSEAKPILVYKFQSDPKRPFRAVKLKNETTYSLNKGVCEVSFDGDFQGKAILEATRPGEESFIVHAKETGVKVHRDVKPVESRRVSIKIKGGVAYCEQASTSVTTYTVVNNKDEEFSMEIEHPRTLRNSTLEVSEGVTYVETASGWRINSTLAKKGELNVTVKEDSLQQNGYSLDSNSGAWWIEQNIVATKNPLSKRGPIQNVLVLQQRVQELRQKINEYNTAVTNTKEEQERLLKLIPQGHQTQADQWRRELGENEVLLRSIQRDKLPALQREVQEATDKVGEALEELTASWSEKDKEAVNGKKKEAAPSDEQ